MAEPSNDVERELVNLEAELKRLEAEYTMYFAGRLKRPPVETQKRVAGMVTRLDRRFIPNFGTKFRFTTLQTRHAKLNQLWERALRAREEGRSGPFARAPEAGPPSPPPASRPPVETDRAMTFTDPAHDVDKLRALHEKVSDARQQTGQAAVPFDEFAELVRGQVAQMKEQGRGEVAFRVAVKDGKVSLTAKGSKGGDGTGGA